ncbi:LLM class flavin-dependent oxidoreductase [Streptomyces sp. NPDC021356]|uniref:LLM class flavin-dependent oxidoreductase n=1 Tax=Streptomyces sp. NPDC021356 TaxID=3154900 RepID=UPI0034010EDB
MPDWMRQAGNWPASPLTLIKEYTTALRRLLRGEPGPANGRYVQCEGVVLTETPATEAIPPVLLGVRGPRSPQAAGEVADGLLLAEPAAPSYIATSLQHMDASAASATGDREIVTYDAAAVDDEEAALARGRAGVEAVGEPEWAAHIDPVPFAAELRAHRAARPERPHVRPDPARRLGPRAEHRRHPRASPRSDRSPPRGRSD